MLKFGNDCGLARHKARCFICAEGDLAKGGVL